VVAAALCVQFRAPLVGRVWFFEDIAAYFEPLWTAAARQMRWGSLPSWDNGAWCGLPLLGDPQVGVLYPLNWLWMIVSPLRLYAWLQLAHAAIGAAGLYRLCRARGRSRAAASLGALSLGLGAFVVLQTRHGMFVATTAWLPWVLWAIERYGAERRREHLAALAGALGLSLLAGGWSMLYFGAWVVGVYALARIFGCERAPGRRARLAAALLGAGALGVALSAAQLLPALAHAQLSPRAIGVDYRFASSYAWPSWRYLITLLWPTWYGDDARGSYLGAPDQWELCGYAIGLVSTLLALFALRLRERRGERLALFALCLIALDLARGDHGLLHPLFFRALPFYGSLRCPARALYVWTLAGPLLAADGLDALAARVREPRRHAFGTAVVLLAALELLVTWRSENPSVKLAATRARPAAAELLLQTPGRYTNDVHLGQRFHNSGLSWGWESAGGYSSLPLWRTLHLYWIANHGAVYPSAKLAHDLTAQGLWRFDAPIVDLLNLRWVLVPASRTIDAPGFVRAWRGPDGVDLWQNRDALPRAFVVYRAQPAPGEPAQARAVADPAWRPDRVAIVDRPLPSVPPPSPGEPLPALTPMTTLVREGPYDLELQVHALAPGVLVISEAWHPGWGALLDGLPVELLRVDYALRGVVLPPGEHLLQLKFVDRPLAWGGLCSLSALALLAFLSRRERRRPSPRTQP